MAIHSFDLLISESSVKRCHNKHDHKKPGKKATLTGATFIAKDK